MNLTRNSKFPVGRIGLKPVASLTKNPFNVALFLLVTGGGLVLSGQILWTLSVYRSDARVASRVKEWAGGESDGLGDAAELKKKEGIERVEGKGAVASGEDDKGEKKKVGEDGKRGEDSHEVAHYQVEKIVLIMPHRSAEVSPDHGRRLEGLARGRTDGKWGFDITAYAGERSSWEKNQRLAARRAGHVVQVLLDLGVAKKNISTKRQVAGKRGRLKSVWRKVEVETRRNQESE